MLMNLTSLILLIILTGILFKLVPEDVIKNLFEFSLGAGLLVALVLIYVMQNVYGYWNFSQIDILNIAEIPIFLSACWMPVVIIFAYFISNLDSIFMIIFLNLIFPLGATFLHYIFLLTGQLSYTNWNLFYTFVVSLVIHLAITLYLYLINGLKLDALIKI